MNNTTHGSEWSMGRRGIATLSFILVVPILAGQGCSETEGEPIGADPSAAEPSDANGGLRKDCPANLPGPAMVLVSTPERINYCIDATEVSQGQYFEFLAELGKTPDRPYVLDEDSDPKLAKPAGCENNRVLGPDTLHMGPCQDYPTAYDYEAKHSDYPVACVNWCAAYAYCAWAGKRLCGRVGGGSLAWSEMGDAKRGQWYNACSQGGTTTYSYGDTFEEGTCAPNPTSLAPGDDPETSVATTTEDTACRGSAAPYHQISNLSGNVAEWQDACQPNGKWTFCGVQAMGAYDAPGPAQSPCAPRVELDQGDFGVGVGFRCCLD